MASPRPGWLVALCAAVLAVSVWLPWVTTSSDGGGRANAAGGVVGNIPSVEPGFGPGQMIVLLASVLAVSGAMAARGFSPRAAAAAALVVSVLIAALTVVFYQLHVAALVVPAYGMYTAAGAAVAAVMCSVWALVVTSLRAR